MADAKKQTRTPKPLYALVTVRDENGAVVKFAAENITVNLERNADKIIELLQGGDTAGATLVRAEMPTAAKRAPKAS